MRIVVLDSAAMNPGDLSWEGIEQFGDLSVYDRTPPDEMLDRAGGAAIVLTNKTVLSRQAIEQLDALRYVGVTATGYNVVDVAAARERGIPVTNVPDYATGSVAQIVFAHLLNLAWRMAHHTQTVRDGKWSACPDFTYWDYPLLELSDMTMGIVGFGRIGRATAQLALAFGMTVLVHTRTPPSDAPEGISLVDLEQVFRESDVVSLHCPLTPETDRLVNGERLEQMKPTAFLINTGRGPLVDEQALANALNSGRIAGAGLDVLSVEPPTPDNPLLAARHCYVTPHLAWATLSARKRLLQVVVDNVAAFLEGRPQNVVNP